MGDDLLPQADTSHIQIGEAVAQRESGASIVDLENQPCPRCEAREPWGFTTNYPKVMVCQTCDFFVTFEDAGNAVDLNEVFKADPLRKYGGGGA